MSSRLGILAAALGVAVLWIVAASFAPLPDTLAVLLFDRSADLYPLTIQNVCWLVFWLCLGELWLRYREAVACGRVIKQQYLPEDETTLLIKEDMNELVRRLKSHHSELADVIRSLALRFQAGNAVDETHALLNTRLELWQYQLDIQYSMIRYWIWLIPTLGFIGTVVGISRALGAAAEIDPNSKTLLAELTPKLGVAFDTTLLALLMSAVLVFIMHWVQGREEQALRDSGEYCVKHFITRLYVKS